MSQAGNTGVYNAAFDLIERNLAAGRADKPAYIDDDGCYSFAELARRVRRCAGALLDAGIQPEQRVLLCLEDSIDFPVAFLGAIWAGAVPIPVNTLLLPADYAQMLRHSRAQALLVSAAQWPAFADLLAPGFRIWISGGTQDQRPAFADLIREDRREAESFDSCADDICFWLYSSGSTGRPKAVAHLHGSPIYTAEHYARAVLGLTAADTVFSASKLFFAYGLGNGLTFPLALGATTVLSRQRPTPEHVFGLLAKHRVSIFCGVPTLFAAMLASPAAPAQDALAVRVCTSAGEGLPRDIGERWRARYGSDILDGIGSTEMLHVFISNRPGDVRYGTTGKPVSGYETRLLADDGREVGEGELGDLHVKGGSAAAMYWADRERSCATFQGEWTRTGDKYTIDADGYYVYGGRSDDMLKVGGIYVSPFEIESALIAHPEVLEAAVIGAADASGLIKPKAYVVARIPCDEDRAAVLCADLRKHLEPRLAPFKRPRWIELLGELPKTATGKVQRYRLRAIQPNCQFNQ